MTLAGVVPIPSQVYMTQDCLHKYTYIFIYICAKRNFKKSKKRRKKKKKKKKEMGKIIIF